MIHTPVSYRAPRDDSWLGTVLAVVGGLAFVVGLFIAPALTWANLLLISYYLLGLGLGGIALVAMQYVSGASWGVALRRMPESLGALIPAASIGVLAVLLVYPALYLWTEHTSESTDPFMAFKHMWLNRPFFLIRAVIYVALWIYFARAIVRNSVRQDEDGKVGHTYTNRRLSGGFLVVFGITCWLSSVDWIMSLEPEWYSTIFGVYQFSGQFLSSLAAVAVLVVWLGEQGALRGILSHDHLHDLGKLLFSFSSFWMYIWFSQYMLIWYVNIPEETSHFIRRQQGGWWALFYLNVLLNWAVPFLVLMPSWTKRNPRILLAVAVVILIGRWIDLYLVIVPTLGQGPLQNFGIVEFGLAAGAVGFFLLVVFRALQRYSLVPINDPLLVESLPHSVNAEHHRLAG